MKTELAGIFYCNFYLGKACQLAYTVCNFQSMKTPVELNSLLSKFFCYITWLDATMDDLQPRPLRQILLFLWNNGLTFKNYKLYTITSLKAIRTNKIETKFNFNPYHHSLRLILRHLVIPNKHVLPDLRLTLTHLVLLLLFLHDRCIQHHGLSNINLTS